MRHPIRLLLYIEWILFAGLMAVEVSPRPPRLPDTSVWINISTIVILAIMGLRLPTGRLSFKILYTLVQIVAIFVAGAIGIRPIGLLCTIVGLRSYLIFGRQYLPLITCGIFAISLIVGNLHPIKNRLVKTALSPEVKRVDSRDEFRWGFVVMFAGILLSLQLLIDRMLAERQAKDELAIANVQIRNYALKAEEVATLQERNRIAREIHDSLGHSLTTLNLYLEMSLKLALREPEQSQAALAEAKRLGSIALQDVRRSVSSLRSDPLQGENLALAIARLVEEFQQSTQIPIQCELDLKCHSLPTEVATASYRIVQEALTNISKYARANAANIAITRDKTSIAIEISDDGSGFDPTHNTTGFGLQGMRERVIALGGKFEIISAPLQGCQIRATIPVKENIIY